MNEPIKVGIQNDSAAWSPFIRAAFDWDDIEFRTNQWNLKKGRCNHTRSHWFKIWLGSWSLEPQCYSEGNNIVITAKHIVCTQKSLYCRNRLVNMRDVVIEASAWWKNAKHFCQAIPWSRCKACLCHGARKRRRAKHCPWASIDQD